MRPDRASSAGRRHLLTVAVEDYYQSGVLQRIVPSDHWNRLETRVEAHTRAALDLLDEFDVKATFFVLGWIADEMPEVVRAIASRGHEVASRGYVHRSLEAVSPGEFRQEIARTREAIERASGQRVVGHRVAMGSLGLDQLWALDVLAEEGFAYDSSLYPRMRSIAHEPFRRFPHVHRHGALEIHEFPLSTWGGNHFLLPVAGGNYFRQFPRRVMERAVSHWDRHYEAPFNMYFNVWELDPDLPRISAVGPLSRVRQYRNLGKMNHILRYYFERYRFGGIAQYLGLHDPGDPPPVPEPERIELRPAPAPSDTWSLADDPRQPVTVVIPCFNEEPTLVYLDKSLDALRVELADDYQLRFVFVDDCSTDGTWACLEQLFGGRSDCRLVHHERNRGVAAAILTGIRAADTEIVCSIDCDCTYDPCQLARLLPMLEDDVAMVTASPYHRDGGVMNVPGWRLMLSRGLSRLYRMVLHHQLATYTSCFRVYRRSALVDVHPRDGGFLGVAETLGILDLRGEKVVECPAVLASRMFGVSKMKTLATIAGHLRLLARLARHRAFSSPPGSAGPQLPLFEKR